MSQSLHLMIYWHKVSCGRSGFFDPVSSPPCHGEGGFLQNQETLAGCHGEGPAVNYDSVGCC